MSAAHGPPDALGNQPLDYEALLQRLNATEADLARERERTTALRDELDQLATCANMLLEAGRDEDSIERLAAHRIMEGIEFSVMRSAWLLGEPDEARRLHALIGDHSPHACPVCTPALAASSSADPAEDAPAAASDEATA